jgi:hypothetical protein
MLASRGAIDAAKERGRFMLSAGRHCGRDASCESILAMVGTTRIYGGYGLVGVFPASVIQF